MKFLPLIWKSLWRKKLRTIMTLVVVFISFVLYGFLMTVKSAFTMGLEVAGTDRLAMMHKVSLIQLLPISYLPQILSTPGVTHASHATWFGGQYQDNANDFAAIAVDPEDYLQLYPEIRVAPDELKALKADRQGAMVGRDLANRHGWKIGDRIPIQGTIWLPKDGKTWYFNVDAIYDADASFDKTTFFFRYDYLDENRRGAYGQVGWYIIRVDNPEHAPDIISRLDSQFANSPAETKTSTEKAFMQGFVNQIGNVGAIVKAIVAAVLFALFFLVTSQTMAQSVRERTSELAVLKTLGFSNGLILTVVISEALFVSIIGGALGLGVVYMLVSSGGFNNPFLPTFVLPPRDIAMGAVLCLAIGIGAAAVPAVNAVRLRIVDGLRRS